MASRKRSLSEFRDASGSALSGFVDDVQYRQSVLQLEPDQDEDAVNAVLVDEARQLGLVSWDTPTPGSAPDAQVSSSSYDDDRPFSDFFESVDSARTPPYTSSSASVRQPSTANTSAVQIPESTTGIATAQPTSSSSYRDRFPSRQSIVSSSTCPPHCSCKTHHQKPPSSSSSIRAQKPPSTSHRYSLDPRRQSTSNTSFYSTSTSSSRRPGSSDSRLRSGLKHAFLHFPPFKKRTSVDSTALSRASSCLECQNQNQNQNQNPAGHPEVEYRKSSAPEVREREWIDPLKSSLRSADEEAVYRSLASPALLTMRSSQQDQQSRHLALRADVVEQMGSVHRERLESQKSQSQKAEQDLAEQHSERAARAEERQLSVELSMLEDFRREKLALQSGIRHMEAYFNTTAPTPPDDNSPSDSDSMLSQRQYTQQHRDRLQQKYHERNSIDTLHEAKIKVLRDKQAKQSEEATRKMEREVTDLAESNTQRYRDLEKHCREEEAVTVEWLEGKEKRLVARWTLEEAVLRKKLELETGVVYGPMPPLAFEASQT